MAAFSRGVARRPLQHRLFTTCNIIRYSSKNAAKNTMPPRTSPISVKKKPSFSPKPKTATNKPAGSPPNHNTYTTPVHIRNATAYGVTQALLKAKTRTLLYESGSHVWMKLSTWGAATMFWGYGAINYGLLGDLASEKVKGIGRWVAWSFVAICIACGGFGFYMFRASYNLVRTIHAVPTELLLQKPGALTRSIDARTTPILLEISVERLLPGLPAKRMTVEPREVRIPYCVFQPTSPFRRQEMSARSIEQKKKEEWEYDRKHLMTVPFRHAGKGLKQVWFGVQRALTKTGFMRMEAGDEKLKLDVASFWALDEGRTIDRLVTIENE